MTLTRLALSCCVITLVGSATGCLNHTRVLYQPKPFKMATVPAPTATPGTLQDGPLVEPPVTKGAGGITPPAQQ